jgi:aromatic ring-cleaving dioxygenase
MLDQHPLDVFAHPNTDGALRAHLDRALWLGRRYQLGARTVGG